MAKEPIAKAFQRDRVDGRRYSRLTGDTTAPTVPTIGEPQANSDSSVTISWTNGTDTQSGLGGSYLEYRLSTGPGAWTRIDVPVSATPNNSYTITGLTSATYYDLQAANYDQAQTPNVSAFSEIRTITTPPSATQLAPGRISIINPTISVIEGGAISIAVERTGQGTLAPSVEADYVFENFAAGTPSPATGTLRWSDATGGVQAITATAGSVTSNQAGRVRITEVRADSGVTLPSLGTSTLAVSVLNDTSTGGGTTYIQRFTEVGREIPTGWVTATNAAVSSRIRQVITDSTAPFGTCLRTGLTKNATTDYRVQANFNGIKFYQRTTGCVGFSVLIESPLVYPLHSFIYQAHHDASEIYGTQGTADDITQVPLRLEVEPAGYRMTAIFKELRAGPNNGLPNTRTIVYGRGPGGQIDLGDAFHAIVPGTWTRFAFRIRWDERYSGFTAGNYPGNLEVWKNGVLVANINYPIGFGAHVAPHPFPGQQDSYNLSLGIYNVAQPVPPVSQRYLGERFADVRACIGSDIGFVL